MKKIQNFQDQQLTKASANSVKGGASSDWKSAAIGFCEWYISLGAKGADSGFLTYLNGVAEKVATS